MRAVTRTIAALGLAFCSAFTAAEEKCGVGGRVTDGKAVVIAKSHLAKYVKNFDPGNYNFSVIEDGCDLNVNIQKKDDRKTGRDSVMVLSRSGAVKKYFGGT